MITKGKKDIKKALVTGGGGFLGKAIVKKLVAAGIETASFSRGWYPELDAFGVAQIQGDLIDADRVQSALKDRDTVFHNPDG